MKITAAILAGGKSKRMNYNNKAFLELNGRTFLEIMLSKISDFDEKIIIANDTDLYTDKYNLKTYSDVFPNIGPIGGIHSALSHASNDNVIIIPCDTPLLNKQLLNYYCEIANDYDAVIPKNNYYYEPLCALYSKSCLNKFKVSIDNGITKVQSLFEELNIRFITENEINLFGKYDIMFKNINTKEEYYNLKNSYKIIK